MRPAANGLGQRSSAAFAPTWASARTTAPRNGQPSDHPENRRTPPGCQERSAMPITTPTAAAAACEGTFSPSSSAAATSANRGVVPETVLVTVGPRSSLERKLSSVTTAGKNSPTSANRLAAVALNRDRSSAKGAAAANSSVAVGMLIAAPERGSSERRPTLAVTWAMPKHSELRSAKAIATLGFRQAQPSLDDLARRRERHLRDHDQALGQLVLRYVLVQQVVTEFLQGRRSGFAPEGYKCTGFLPEHRVGHRHDRRLQDLRMRVEQPLHVGRIELDAAAVDDVLDAAGDRDVAALAHLAQIARAEPAVVRKCRFIRFRVIEITREEHRAAHLYLALGRKPHFGAGTRPAGARCRPLQRIAGTRVEARLQLGHAPELGHRALRNRVGEFPDQRGRSDRARHDGELERGPVVPAEEAGGAAGGEVSRRGPQRGSSLLFDE